jgi:ABC-type ATPase involved in cell division
VPSTTDALYDDTPAPKLAANMRVDPLELEWQRIGCSYRTATGTKVVLQDVYGRAAPGEMQVRGGQGRRGRGAAGGGEGLQQRRARSRQGSALGWRPAQTPDLEPLAPRGAAREAARHRPPRPPFTPPPPAPHRQALLGPSGAGKSTLMDILAQRKSVGALTGQLLVGGRPVTSSFIRKTAYVPQDDNFVPTMTTMETMRFYAAIILPDSMGRAGRRQRVEEVLSAVGLGTHHKTLVGGVLPGGLMLRGLSGGERKRLSIAAGILAAPSVVFLDEPTSGLDSFAALTVRPGRAAGGGVAAGEGCAAPGLQQRVPTPPPALQWPRLR